MTTLTAEERHLRASLAARTRWQKEQSPENLEFQRTRTIDNFIDWLEKHIDRLNPEQVKRIIDLLRLESPIDH